MKSPENIPASGKEAPKTVEHSPQELFEATLEYVELNRQLKEQGVSWKKVRGEKGQSEPVPSMPANAAELIRSGRAGEILSARRSKPGAAELPEAESPEIERRKARLSVLEGYMDEIKKGAKEKTDSVRGLFHSMHDLKTISTELDSLEVLEMEIDQRELKAANESGGSDLRAQEAFREIEAIREAINDRRDEYEGSREAAPYVRLHEILEYKREIAEHGYAATPSRKAYMRKVAALFEQGQAVLLTGPTGSGKTEIFRYYTRRFYGGRNPEIIRCTDRTTPAEIFGKSALRATETGGTESVFNRGRFTVASDEGVPLIFDEFNLLETRTRMGMKELYNRRPGDTIVVQEDSGKPHKIQPGFAIGATANIKDAKHRERFELDAAETRALEMIRINYMPPHEAYDLLLATLAHKNGSLPLSRKDAEETLKFLSDAATMTQEAYLGLQQSIPAAGGASKGLHAVLEKAVLDPGRLIKMLSGYRVANAKGQSFYDFTSEKLASFVNQEDFSESDKRLLVQIFGSKGFFDGYEPSAFSIPGLTRTEMQTFGIKPSPRNAVGQAYMPPEQVANLDPYKVRRDPMTLVATHFLERKKTGPKKPEQQPEFRALFDREAERIRMFFGEDKEVPALPHEITRAKYEAWKSADFDLRFLPRFELKPGMTLPGGEAPYLNSKDDIFELVAKGNIAKKSIALPGKWVLVDESSYHGPDGSLKFGRTGISWKELSRTAARTPLASGLGVDIHKIRFPHVFEAEFLNRTGPLRTNVADGEVLSEWTEDAFGNDQRVLVKTHAIPNATMITASKDARMSGFGFRFLVEF